jgi:IS30 family transposase
MPDLRKYKHMTLDERIEVQECLNKGVSFKAIARRIGKDPTTVSKEVKKHIHIKENPHSKTEGTTLVKKPCPLLSKAPFVCNSCKRHHLQCGYQKQLYNAQIAQREYETLLVEARDGIALTRETFFTGDKIIAQEMKKGQRLYHIMETHDVPFSESTAYRNLHKGYLSVGKLDFPRVAKFKPRKQHKGDYIPKAAKVGRTYNDFRLFVEENNINSWVEMDTVIGRVGGKVIMTFDFTYCNFMFGLLLDNKTSSEAALKITTLKSVLHDNGIRFGDIFPLLLTDNGGEFANVLAFTEDLNGDTETDLLFCDPNCAYQKPRVEKNHTVFRDIVPKGSSFDHFTQETVNLIFSHVNSIKRKSLNKKTPYEMFSFMHGYEIAALLGIYEIPATEVVQSPLLLKSQTKTPLVEKPISDNSKGCFS